MNNDVELEQVPWEWNTTLDFSCLHCPAKMKQEALVQHVRIQHPERWNLTGEK
jgi:hypothetical protein